MRQFLCGFCAVYGQESFLYEVVFFMGVFVADDVK
jgi:hypothetical protein